MFIQDVMVQMLMVLLGLSLLWQDNIRLQFIVPSSPPPPVLIWCQQPSLALVHWVCLPS